MSVAIVIPARYKSSRFPGKPLIDIYGKPMVIRVADICSKAINKNKVFIATDSKKIKTIVNRFNYNCILTSNKNLTGTDRVAEASKKIDAKIIINVQGDEPLLDYKDINKIISYKKKYPNKIINAYCNLSKYENQKNLNIPKVVISENSELIYMSRAEIPGSKKKISKKNYLKQVCIYAYNKNELNKFKKFGKKSKTEFLEDIEILRFIDLGFSIKMIKLKKSSQAVDTLKDLKLVKKLLANAKNYRL